MATLKVLATFKPIPTAIVVTISLLGLAVVSIVTYLTIYDLFWKGQFSYSVIFLVGLWIIIPPWIISFILTMYAIIFAGGRMIFTLDNVIYYRARFVGGMRYEDVSEICIVEERRGFGDQTYIRITSKKGRKFYAPAFLARESANEIVNKIKWEMKATEPNG